METWVYTCAHTVTQAEIDATATGTDPQLHNHGDRGLQRDRAGHRRPGDPDGAVPGFELAKTSDPESGTPVAVGQTVTYTLTGSNTGVTVLNPVTITDDLSAVLDDAELIGPPTVVIESPDSLPPPAAPADPVIEGTTLTWTGALRPGDKVTITYSVAVTGRWRSRPAQRRQLVRPCPQVRESIVPPPVEVEHQVPGLDATKSSDVPAGTVVGPGDKVTYTVTVTNTGAVLFTELEVIDDVSGVLDDASVDEGSLSAAIGGQPVDPPTFDGATARSAGSVHLLPGKPW